MIISILLFAVGLLFLIKGGDWFVDGASALARRFHLLELLIGATVVSIGIDITQLSGWGIPERPSPSSASSLRSLERSKHGRSVATGQPAEKPTGTAPNPCEAASA